MINKNPNGFTLIETLLAVLLLASAIAGPLTIASKGISAGLVAKDQITAFYLAQDAMEYVRYARDSACLAAGSSGCDTSIWLSTLGPCVSTDGSVFCKIDSVTGAVSTFAATDILKYDSTTHAYGYTSGTQTPQKYTRKISIVNTVATPDEAVVTVSVTWSDVAGVTHAPVTIRENIFRWE